MIETEGLALQQCVRVARIVATNHCNGVHVLQQFVATVHLCCKNHCIKLLQHTLP